MARDLRDGGGVVTLEPLVACLACGDAAGKDDLEGALAEGDFGDVGVVGVFGDAEVLEVEVVKGVNLPVQLLLEGDHARTSGLPTQLRLAEGSNSGNILLGVGIRAVRRELPGKGIKSNRKSGWISDREREFLKLGTSKLEESLPVITGEAAPLSTNTFIMTDLL